jgi:alpha-mannosidase
MHESSELIGKNNFKYSLQLSKCYTPNINFIKKAKEKKNKPDVVVKLGYDSPRSLSNSNAMFNVEGESIIVSACYMDSGKTIIRIYEAEGKSCEARITLAKEYSTAYISDFFGKNVYDNRLQETKEGICIKLNSFEIVTLCFE